MSIDTNKAYEAIEESNYNLHFVERSMKQAIECEFPEFGHRMEIFRHSRETWAQAQEWL